MTDNRDIYKTLLVSQSGKGKTYSFRNLNPETTGFINTENKPLPFKNRFKFHARPLKFPGALQALKDYSANPEIDVIVIDSLSAVMEMLLEECRANYRGFDIWSNYNQRIGEYIKLIKQAPKEVFVTAHYETLNLEGDQEKRVKVKGKEWEGVIEKEFTLVLYADAKFKESTADYFFRLAGEGLSAKCPPGIFGEGTIKIQNDCQFILDKLRDFTDYQPEARAAVAASTESA